MEHEQISFTTANQRCLVVFGTIITDKLAGNLGSIVADLVALFTS